jgi:hypothetical protein
MPLHMDQLAAIAQQVADLDPGRALIGGDKLTVKEKELRVLVGSGFVVGFAR